MDYFSLLSEKFGKEEAERKVDAKISSFSGLLTRDAAARLIAAEEGLLKEQVLPISKIKDGARDANIRGKIKKIFPMQEYRTGKRSRSLLLKDETGEMEVKLWNEDADSVSGFHLGDTVKVSSGYMREKILNIGYRGRVELEGREELLTPSNLREGVVSCRGRVSAISGMNGDEFLFSISDGQKEARVCITHIPERGGRLSVGDTVMLEGAECDGHRLFLGEHSRMLVKKNSPDIFRGELGDFEVGAEGARIRIGGEEFHVAAQELVRFLKLEGLKKDIDLPAVARMKLTDLEGKWATVLFEQREGAKHAKDISVR
ncbi:MAG: hypothetical protein AB1657_05050 [Candidatus Micrarchaeota archaeon]